MKYLAIDTSGKHLTVVIEKDEEVFLRFIEDDKVKHSENLMTITEDLLEKSGLLLKDLDFIACVVGAGSFTGIRIGIATVKALSFSSGKPFLSITSFDTLAYNKGKGKVLAVIDAGHGGFYACGYADRKISFSPRFILKDELLSLKGEYEFISGEAIDDIDTETVSVKDGLIFAVREKAAEKSFDYEKLVPLYLRKSQAEEGRP